MFEHRPRRGCAHGSHRGRRRAAGTPDDARKVVHFALRPPSPIPPSTLSNSSPAQHATASSPARTRPLRPPPAPRSVCDLAGAESGAVTARYTCPTRPRTPGRSGISSPHPVGDRPRRIAAPARRQDPPPSGAPPSAPPSATRAYRRLSGNLSCGDGQPPFFTPGEAGLGIGVLPRGHFFVPCTPCGVVETPPQVPTCRGLLRRDPPALFRVSDGAILNTAGSAASRRGNRRCPGLLRVCDPTASSVLHTGAPIGYHVGKS